jgi:PAS domain S-box-containing protein
MIQRLAQHYTHRLAQFPLGIRLAVACVLVEILLMTVLFSVMLLLTQQSLEAQFEKRSQDIAQLLSEALVEPLVRKDYAQALDLVRRFVEKESDMLQIQVYDLDNTLIASASITRAGPLHQDENNIQVGGQTYGRLYFSLSTATIQRDQREILFTLIVSGGIVVFCSILFFLALGHLLTRRLRQLTHCAEALARGDDYQPLPAVSPDEVGQLIQAFTSMSHSLQERMQQLAAQSLRLNTLLDNASDGIHVMDAQGNLVQYSHAFARMLGYNDAALAGKNISQWEAGIPPEQLRTTLEAVLRGGQTFETCYRRQDGSGFPVEINAVPVVLEGVPYIFASARDITERKRYETELRDARDAAEAANRAKTTFLANMSHELRTPMNAIMGMTSLALHRSRDSRQEEQLHRVMQASNHLLGIINDVLDLSKLEAERLSLIHEAFLPGTVLEAVRNLVAPAAEEKRLQLTVSIAPALHQQPLYGDAQRLHQVLLNLAGNAVKFTEQGEVEIKASVAQEDSQHLLLHIEVRDTGIGIPHADQQQLFLPFAQVDSTMTRKYGGTGLGLVISKRLVELMGGELMGGELGLESRPGFGSCFWVRITLEKVVQAPIVQPEEAETLLPSTEQQLQQQFAGCRILLAEDEPINQEVTRSLLEEVGLVVEVAESGAAVLRKARVQSYDLILMDLLMPEINGLETACTLRQQAQQQVAAVQVPIIGLTGSNVAEAQQSACYLQAGITDYLVKPFGPEALFAVVLRCLRGGMLPVAIPTAPDGNPDLHFGACNPDSH